MVPTFHMNERFLKTNISSHPPGLRSELEQLRSRLENTDQELQVCESLHHKSPYCDYIDLKIIFYFSFSGQMYYFPVFIIILFQRTNATLRRLGDEMRSYSQEKSRQREEELRIEVGLF